MGNILRTVAYGIEKGSPNTDNRSVILSVARQLYIYSYPYWIVEYRRIQSYSYALGVYIALRPSIILEKLNFTLLSKINILIIYISTGVAGFLIPIKSFELLRPFFYKIAKRNKDL